MIGDSPQRYAYKCHHLFVSLSLPVVISYAMEMCICFQNQNHGQKKHLDCIPDKSDCILRDFTKYKDSGCKLYISEKYTCRRDQ